MFVDLKNLNLNDDKVFGIFLSVRLLSVLLVQTFYVPDEYWQSLEIAHKLTYGYGYKTWEWTYGIRSYIHPLTISIFYKVVQLLGVDYTEVLIYLPRILQAVLSSYADLCFFRWSLRKKWAIFIIATSFFWYYVATRTLLNTFETALTVIALSNYPWIGRGNYECKKFLTLVAITCVIRPTAAVFWLPMCLFHLLTCKEPSAIIIKRYIPIGVLVLTFSVVIDSLAHGSFLFSSYEFFKFNFLEGIGEHYGSQPWHWYMSQALPAILGIHMLTFTLSCLDVIRNRKNSPNELQLLFSIIFTIAVYSFITHKEFRFILPLLPVMLHITSNYLSKWSVSANDLLVWFVAGVVLTANVIPAWYLGFVHQRGTLDIMQSLREIAATNSNNSSFLFLMPCHSTPLYSHLHVNVTTRFLTCEPNFNKTENYVDEADEFYKDPNMWLRHRVPPNSTLPTHLILYDNLVPTLSSILSRYKPIKRIFHTSFPNAKVGRYVMLYQRVDIN